MPGQVLQCNADLVLCIDGTASMGPIIEEVKESARNFYGKIVEALKAKDRAVDVLRIKVVVFRDYYCDGDKAMKASEFFTFPGQAGEFNSFVSSIVADGGGDEPENALEAIFLAMKSDWTKEGARKRHIIMVWTDASAHELEKSISSKPSNYPEDMPRTLSELSDLWNDSQGMMNVSTKRLIIFAPDMYPWSEIGPAWENTVWVPSKAGQGLGDTDVQTVLDVLAGSI